MKTFTLLLLTGLFFIGAGATGEAVAADVSPMRVIGFEQSFCGRGLTLTRLAPDVLFSVRNGPHSAVPGRKKSAMTEGAGGGDIEISFFSKVTTLLLAVVAGILFVYFMLRS